MHLYLLQEFPISEDKLIELAKELFAKESGLKDESLLADGFRFEFPVVSLDRQVRGMRRGFALRLSGIWLWLATAPLGLMTGYIFPAQSYLKAVRGFDLKGAFPGAKTRHVLSPHSNAQQLPGSLRMDSDVQTWTRTRTTGEWIRTSPTASGAPYVHACVLMCPATSE